MLSTLKEELDPYLVIVDPLLGLPQRDIPTASA
jgi:hypothetical protein